MTTASVTEANVKWLQIPSPVLPFVHFHDCFNWKETHSAEKCHRFQTLFKTIKAKRLSNVHWNYFNTEVYDSFSSFSFNGQWQTERWTGCLVMTGYCCCLILTIGWLICFLPAAPEMSPVEVGKKKKQRCVFTPCTSLRRKVGMEVEERKMWIEWRHIKGKEHVGEGPDWDLTRWRYSE